MVENEQKITPEEATNQPTISEYSIDEDERNVSIRDIEDKVGERGISVVVYQAPKSVRSIPSETSVKRLGRRN